MLNRASMTETAEGVFAVLLAREARVGRFVYQSVHRLDQLAHLPHVAAKLAIQNGLTTSGLSYTLICPNHFYKNDDAVRRPLVEDGLYVTPLGPIGCDCVDARDIAAASAIALTEQGNEGKAYALVGPERLTSPPRRRSGPRRLAEPFAPPKASRPGRRRRAPSRPRGCTTALRACTGALASAACHVARRTSPP
jgi:uncharacterized protein YbjT (DUF2867 family)